MTRPSPAPSGSARAAVPTFDTAEQKPVTEQTQRVATMRVAIPASARDASVFVVRKLAKGQPLPPGTKEATLVLTGDEDAQGAIAE